MWRLLGSSLDVFEITKKINESGISGRVEFFDCVVYFRNLVRYGGELRLVFF